MVDDVLIASEKSNAEEFISAVSTKYRLGAIVYGPTEFLFFGLHIIQEFDISVPIHGDSNLNALSCFLIDRHRRKQSSE